MKTMIPLSDSELVSARGGTAGEGDTLSRDFGQYVGGFVGAYVHNPRLGSMPVFGIFYLTWSGIAAATN